MAGPGICVLCLADTCTSEVHSVFNPVAPYGYLLSDMYLVMADTTTAPAIQRVRMAGMPKKTVNQAPHCWGPEGSTQFAQQLESAVTAPPLVGCVVWSLTFSGPSSYPIPLI